MRFTNRIDYENFIEDILVYNTVLRQFEIIGEAANRVSVETREMSTNILWREIIDFRNLLIHEYHGVD